jgi:cytochrome b561
MKQAQHKVYAIVHLCFSLTTVAVPPSGVYLQWHTKEDCPLVILGRVPRSHLLTNG